MLHLSIDYCARFLSTRSNECYTIHLYTSCISLSLSLFSHRDTIYLFYIFFPSFLFYHCCSRRENDSSSILFSFSSGWTEIGQVIHMHIWQHDILSRCTYRWKRRIIKSRIKGSESSYLRSAGCRHFWLVVRRMAPLLHLDANAHGISLHSIVRNCSFR